MIFYYYCTDANKKQDDIILPPPLVPMKVVDDFEDVDRELEAELENMDLDDIESTVTHLFSFISK